MQHLPEKPKLITALTGFQKWLAGVSGSMFIMSVITLLPFIESLFKPNYLLFLSTLRMAMAATSLITGGFVGIPQIKSYIGWIIDFYDFYKKFKDNDVNKK